MPSQGFQDGHPTKAQSPLQTFAKHSIAGTLGGMNVVLVGHPFDTIKVRLQTQSSTKPLYSGVVDCFMKTLRWEGVRGLYKGMSSPLYGQMAFRATYFAAFEGSRKMFSRDEHGNLRPSTTLDLAKAGALTGAAAALAETPIDFYKSQLQVQMIRQMGDPNYKPPFTTLSGAIKASFMHNGWRGAYQGFGITVLRNIPANAVYISSFEFFKHFFADQQGVGVRELSMPLTMLAGSIAGVLFWVSIYPLDVIKSAMMTDSMSRADRAYPTMASTVKALWADGGAKRFMRGFAPCLIRAAPANAAMLSTVSKMQILLGV